MESLHSSSSGGERDSTQWETVSSTIFGWQVHQVVRKGEKETMKRIIIALAATLMAVAVVGSIAYAGQTETGNGAPSGAHYNLNIIGVDNPKNFVATDPFVDPNNGRRMF